MRVCSLGTVGVPQTSSAVLPVELQPTRAALSACSIVPLCVLYLPDPPLAAAEHHSMSRVKLWPAAGGRHVAQVEGMWQPVQGMWLNRRHVAASRRHVVLTSCNIRVHTASTVSGPISPFSVCRIPSPKHWRSCSCAAVHQLPSCANCTHCDVTCTVCRTDIQLCLLY